MPETYGPIHLGGPKDLFFLDLWTYGSHPKDLVCTQIQSTGRVLGGYRRSWNAQMKTLCTMKLPLFEFRDHARDLKTYSLDLWTYSFGWT